MGNPNKKNVCCICGRKFDGWGNNPWPIAEKGECCQACNFKHVIPARIALLRAEREETTYANAED